MTSSWWLQGIVRLRRRRLTGTEIAWRVPVSPATVARILARHGLSKLKALEPKEPVRRYERELPGELVHLDITPSRLLPPGVCGLCDLLGVVSS